MTNTHSVTLMLLLAVLLLGCGEKRYTAYIDDTYQVDAVASARALEKTDRAIHAMNNGNAKDAEQLLREALSDDPGNGRAHNALGVLALQRQDLLLAARQFQKAVDLLPERSEPLNNLGLALETANRLPQSIARYRSALALAPMSLEYKCNLARALWRSGDRSGELRDLLTAIAAEDIRQEWSTWARRCLLDATFRDRST